MTTSTLSPTAGMSVDQVLALVEEGKKELGKEISNLRAQLYFKCKQLAGMGGVESYADGILTVAKKQTIKEKGKKEYHGVTAADLHIAFPDILLLKEAREFLEIEKQIVVSKSGMTFLFQPVNIAAAPASDDAQADEAADEPPPVKASKAKI